MRISGITVAFGRTIQPAQYETKKAEATISIVPNDEDSFLSEDDAEKAFDIARRKVYETLGMTSEPKSPKSITKPSPKQSEKIEETKKPDIPEKPVEVDVAAEVAAIEAEEKEAEASAKPKRKPGRPKKEDTKTEESSDTKSEVQYTSRELMSAINGRMAYMRDHNVSEPSKHLRDFLKSWVIRVYPEDLHDQAHQASQITAKVIEQGDNDLVKEFIDGLEKIGA